MDTRETPKRSEANWKRRAVLKTVGAGAAVPFVGVASAKGGRGKGGQETPGSERGTPGCPDCPDGTTLLAKYEYDEEADAFVFEKGTCDAAHDFEITNKDGEENEPIAVDFVSDIFAHSVVVKFGRNCERFDAGDEEFEMSSVKDSDGFEGRIDLSGQRYAISHISFCAGVCYQVDFVEGDPIRELGEDGLYGRRKIALVWGSTRDPVNERETRNRSPYETDDWCTITTDGIEVADGTASVTFTVEENCRAELSLASHLAPCPPEFDPDTADRQVLFDYAPENAFDETQQYDSGTHTLDVELPGLDDLSLLCDESQ